MSFINVIRKSLGKYEYAYDVLLNYFRRSPDSMSVVDTTSTEIDSEVEEAKNEVYGQ